MLSFLRLSRVQAFSSSTWVNSKIMLPRITPSQTRSLQTTHVSHKEAQKTKPPKLSRVEARRKKLAEELGISEDLLPPKRPWTAVNYLFAEVGPLPEHVGKSAKDKMDAVSTKWKAMSEAEQQVYKDKADAAKAKYEEEVKQWANSVHPDLIHRIKKHGLKDGRIKGIVAAKYSEDVKKPLAPYIQFTKEFRVKFAEDHDGPWTTRETLVTFIKAASAAWKALPEAEKDVYRKRYADAKEEYLSQIGNSNLKGSSTVLKRPPGAYALFVKDYYAQNRHPPGLRAQAVNSQVAQAWKLLSETEKEVYRKRAKEAEDAYKAKLEKLN